VTGKPADAILAIGGNARENLVKKNREQWLP
jgi:hypothetical protein